MSKNTVDIANALLAEKAALEARVKAAEDAADKYLHEAKRHQRALLAAEAELERLKAQEPVAYSWRSARRAQLTRTIPEGWKQPRELTPLYAEPRPAVLPDKLLPFPSNDKEELAYARGYNDAVDKARTLGCQPQRFVVKRPGTKCIGWVKEAIHEHDQQWFEAIKAAGGEISE